MEVHETSWPSLDHEDMTAVSRSIQPSQALRRHGSTSHDQEWTDFLRSCPQNGLDSTNSDGNTGFGFLGPDNEVPVRFGAMNDYHDRSQSMLANGPLSSTLLPDQNVVAFQGWPLTKHAPMMAYEPTSLQSAPWLAEQRQQQYQAFENSPSHPTAYHPEGLGISIAPTSHPIDQPQHALHFADHFGDYDNPVTPYNYHPDVHEVFKYETAAPSNDELFAGDEHSDREASSDPADPCYAQLLYLCLKEAPDHTMSLRELYEWVQQHSQKAKDPKNRGWQNSVRHNLSMNAAFARVHNDGTSSTLPKKGSLWRLTDQALRDGVISTTRYRKDPKRRPDLHRRAQAPALNRQTSGAKGGRATRDATRARQARERARRSPASSSPYYHQPQMMLPATPPEYESPLYYPKPQQQQPVFEFLPLDFGAPMMAQHGGLFGNFDPESEAMGLHTPTPSLMTEASWAGEEMLQPPSSVVEQEEGAGVFMD